MILRWHYFRNIVTARDVDEYRNARGCSLADAWREIAAETPRVLQFSVDQGATWYDVPIVSEPHPAD